MCCALVEVGCRVVRGPHWNWGCQDGGDGHVGTVVEVGSAGSANTPDRTVFVLWDSGNRTNYRCGYQNAYDLSVFDTAPTGVRHVGSVCVGCREQSIAGIRWRCSVCAEHDLCSTCYMNDVHDTSHPFIRYDRPAQHGERVASRRDSVKRVVHGVFVGAKVVRGYHWEWADQDGGSCGRVTEVVGWSDESRRSVANVTWSVTGVSNVYRLGHQGKVDLKYTTHGDVSGGAHYLDHLPVLGKPIDASCSVSASIVESSAVSDTTVTRTADSLCIGDRVKISRDASVLQALQQGHGGWNKRMAEYVGLVGVVHRITERGDVRVQYMNNVRWTVNPAALVRAHVLSSGEKVRVIEDITAVQQLQRGHGEWVDAMRSCLGRLGQVTRVYADGDVRVAIDGQTWTLNSLCVVSAAAGSPIVHSDRHHTNGNNCAAGAACAGVVTNGSVGDGRVAQCLNRDAAQGRSDSLKLLLLKHPHMVDIVHDGRTALQLASHQGHVTCVTLLLQHGADITRVDDDGDTVLHYAAFGDQCEVISQLTSWRPDSHAVSDGVSDTVSALLSAANKSGCTALHVAVSKQHVRCVSALLDAGANANLQDMYGDTALHDAIDKPSIEIVELLTASRVNIDASIVNKRGFNALHHAALKGNTAAVRRFLVRQCSLLSVAKNDGFTCLHLASVNGHLPVVKLLLSTVLATNNNSDNNNNNNNDSSVISDGGNSLVCLINAVNCRQQTALLLACTQLHIGVAELLAVSGASVSRADSDGNTCLNVVCARVVDAAREQAADTCCVAPSAVDAPRVHGIWSHQRARGVQLSGPQSLACFLCEQGACLSAPNNQGQTAVDILTAGSAGDSFIIQLLRWYSRQHSVSEALQLPSMSDLHVQQRTCSVDETVANVARAVDVDTKVVGVVPPGNQPDSAALNSLTHNAANLKLQNDEELCVICCECRAAVRFSPCGHQVTCTACCQRMKKCVRCHTTISRKQCADGSSVSDGFRARATSADRLRQLESKIAEIEEVHGCSICLERRRNVVFLCGHGACAVCAHALTNCHMCRKPITQKINVY